VAAYMAALAGTADAPPRRQPPCGIRRTSSFNRRDFDLRMSFRRIGSVTGVSHFESLA